jgi:hypothetical protein
MSAQADINPSLTILLTHVEQISILQSAGNWSSLISGLETYRSIPTIGGRVLYDLPHAIRLKPM